MYNILVIEDDDQYVEVLKGIFDTKQEYNITYCKNEIEVDTAMIGVDNLDLIISDIELGEINGDQICAVLIETGKLDTTPIIFCSGMFNENLIVDKNNLKKFDGAFFIDFVQKGNMRWLLYKISSILKMRERFVNGGIANIIR